MNNSPSISDKALIVQERRAISNILQYIQKIAYDVRIPEFVRAFKFVRTIRMLLKQFSIKSEKLNELKEFRFRLENILKDVVTTCQSYGVYDYTY